MRTTTIYLHSPAKRLQTIIHLLSAAFLIYKVYHLPFGSEFYYRFISLYIFITFLLLTGSLLQVVKKYKYQESAKLLNMFTGLFLIIESLAKMDIGVSNLYFVTLGLGTFITLIGACDNQIRQIPHISFKKEQVSGRLSLLQPFSYSWQDIADIDIKPVRVKITLKNGKIIRYRVARRSANRLLLKSAEDKCWEIMESQRELQMA